MVITRWAVKFDEFFVDVYSFYIRYFPKMSSPTFPVRTQKPNAIKNQINVKKNLINIWIRL